MIARTVRQVWRRAQVESRAPASVRQLEHVLPAIALLWVPVVLAVWGNLPGSRDVKQGLPMLRALMIGGLAPLLIATGAARLRARTWSATRRLLWSEGWLTERPIRHVLMSVSLAAFFWAFAIWKCVIPTVQAFRWDERLSRWDRLVHGDQVNVMLAPWFGSPRALIALDQLYETWWFVLLGFLLWQIWQPDLEKAKRLLLAFALTWIVLGIFVATAISSAGPCFAGLISGTHRYDTLLARLDAANAVSPLLALKGQAYLWQAYASGAVPVGGGISAFPSLHVGGAALCAIALYERNRLLGWAGWIYVALTWIASIMLGWHYSLDGEAAVVGVVLCWTVAGILTTPIPGELSVPLRSWSPPEPVPEPSAARVERPSSSGKRDGWTLWP